MNWILINSPLRNLMKNKKITTINPSTILVPLLRINSLRKFMNLLQNKVYPQEVGNKADQILNKLPPVHLQILAGPSQGPNPKVFND